MSQLHGKMKIKKTGVGWNDRLSCQMSDEIRKIMINVFSCVPKRMYVYASVCLIVFTLKADAH